MVLKSIFQLKALTEIWTANDDVRKGNILRETGLIGSWRWWYEALVRGLGGVACGAVGGGCGYEPGKKDESGREIPREKQICPVCELFGCTGWSRQSS
jgi:CRISPR-associated protein Cmr1